MTDAGMIEIPAGTYWMGCDRFYREEQPLHEVAVDPFAIDRGPVTVSQFAQFVEQTGYVTLAERPPDPSAYPGADPAPARRRVGGLPPDAPARAAERPAALVGLRAGRRLASSLGSAKRER